MSRNASTPPAAEPSNATSRPATVSTTSKRTGADRADRSFRHRGSRVRHMSDNPVFHPLTLAHRPAAPARHARRLPRTDGAQRPRRHALRGPPGDASRPCGGASRKRHCAVGTPASGTSTRTAPAVPAAAPSPAPATASGSATAPTSPSPDHAAPVHDALAMSSDHRFNRQPVIVTGQSPGAHRHRQRDNPALANAIRARLVHRPAHRTQRRQHARQRQGRRSQTIGASASATQSVATLVAALRNNKAVQQAPTQR